MLSVLGKWTFDVRVARDEAQAMDLIERQQFDFALVDLNLGGATDGIRLIERIKAHQPRTRIVLITGYPSDETRSEAATKGASAYLEKPFDLAVLLRTFTSLTC